MRRQRGWQVGMRRQRLSHPVLHQGGPCAVDHADLADELRQGHEMIRRSRALIKVTDKLIITSLNQIDQSLKRMRAPDRAEWFLYEGVSDLPAWC